MANGPKVILRIISVLVVVSIFPRTWGGGRVGVGRSEFKAMLSKYKGSLSQDTREEARKNTGMLSLSCLPGPASVISHFLVCLRGFYFIDYFKRQSQSALSEILLSKIIQYRALLILPERMIAGIWNDDRQATWAVSQKVRWQPKQLPRQEMSQVTPFEEKGILLNA